MLAQSTLEQCHFEQHPINGLFPKIWTSSYFLHNICPLMANFSTFWFQSHLLKLLVLQDGWSYCYDFFRGDREILEPNSCQIFLPLSPPMVRYWGLKVGSDYFFKRRKYLLFSYCVDGIFLVISSYFTFLNLPFFKFLIFAVPSRDNKTCRKCALFFLITSSV